MTSCQRRLLRPESDCVLIHHSDNWEGALGLLLLGDGPHATENANFPLHIFDLVVEPLAHQCFKVKFKL